MTDRLRRYRETRGSAVEPLPELARHLEEHGPPGPAEIRDLAARLALPPAAVRGALSFFADLHPEPHPGSGAPRFCRGTSCWLAREGGLGGPPAEGEGVYCLGFCDRSPARLLPDGGVELGGASDGAAQDFPGPPAMRSLTAEPLVLRNALRGDASALEDARAAGVYGALEGALAAGPEAVLAAMERSGERGRGGAAFPAGLKWRRCAQAPGGPKHVVANGDEGDPGSFVDRVLMERDPHSILEGMIL
ncbi:MAG TPA: hypothetical protein VF150_10370, partial [Thermoanaerobaculia bacterium]